jgi:hypothetical protein
MTTYMVLDSYTFTKNPSEATLPNKHRLGHEVETIGGIEFFSWGATIVGKKITLKWDYMLTAQFNSLQTILDGDAEVTFQPGDGNTFNVQVLRLNGAYFLDNESGAELRKSVTLEMIIISQV